MTIMKQIDHCLTRAFNGKLPAPSKKWKAFIVKEFDGYHYLKVFHYQHLIMLYRIETGEILYEWWEKRADKRGLDSIREWLLINKGIISKQAT